jgi:hypothetical protein
MERVSLELIHGAHIAKNGAVQDQDFEAGPKFSQSPISTAVGDMTAAVFVNL